ncbi:MAG: L,D-transpeptidase, partial [Arcobacteraceae bacterium]
RKKADTETLKVKEEKEKALAEFKEIESKKAISEELRKKADTKTLKVKEEKEKALSKELHNLNNLDNFENLLIKVDSAKNIMFLKGKNSDGEITDIKTYKVSTAKTTVKKPLGVGYITSISLNPQWNPTNKTLKAFKEKGINLPSIVPFGDKLNYMGAAKINLSHKVDGQEVYRIHGTLSENTIGTNESSGCIRMKNKEIVELATLLEKFSKTKNYNNISVILE